SAAGVGDLRLGAASGLLVAPFRLTATLLLGLPVGDPAPGVGGDLATGGGDLTLEAHLAAGHSLALGPVGLYGILDAGFRKRGLASRDGTMPTPATTRYADELLYLAELGAQIRKPGFDRVWLAVRSNGLDSLAADRDIVDGYSGLRPGTRYTGLGIALDARVVATWHVGGEVDSALDARLVPAGAALQLYLAFERCRLSGAGLPGLQPPPGLGRRMNLGRRPRKVEVLVLGPVLVHQVAIMRRAAIENLTARQRHARGQRASSQVRDQVPHDRTAAVAVGGAAEAWVGGVDREVVAVARVALAQAGIGIVGRRNVQLGVGQERGQGQGVEEPPVPLRRIGGPEAGRALDPIERLIERLQRNQRAALDGAAGGEVVAQHRLAGLGRDPGDQVGGPLEHGQARARGFEVVDTQAQDGQLVAE